MFLAEMQPEPTLHQAQTPHGSPRTFELFFEPWQEPDRTSPAFNPSIPNYPRPRLPHGSFFPLDMRSIPNTFGNGEDLRPIRPFYNTAMSPVPIQPGPGLHQPSKFRSDMCSTPNFLGKSQDLATTRALSNTATTPVPIQPRLKHLQTVTPTAVMWNTANFFSERQRLTSTVATFDPVKFPTPIAPKPAPGEQFLTSNVRDLRPNLKGTPKTLSVNPPARTPSMVSLHSPRV
ncbi:hypothetical protein BGZ60DRAFT_58236 [Tricladium varicosporioides]|nr:hypothetical protein BGZ60DRAFT_58236 [Hymenoscyphus varicosporioides]